MPNEAEIDLFVEKFVIDTAKETLQKHEDVMPCFFTFGDVAGAGEVCVMPIDADLSKPDVKNEIIATLKQLKKEKPFHTAVFVSDAHFKAYEGMSSQEAMAERQKFDARLSEDPDSKEAIVVARITARGGSTIMVEHKELDDGTISFEKPSKQAGIHSSWMTRIWEDVN